ncbi:thiamine-binding protein [Mammaliicoccus sciuri]|uniref:thiamine-binding protein n=1 Tax=Mammaliicoccus sciuri TaxID=1296 RepID=UPI001E51EFCA|nr:MTH1187 family thiamine-binding protein [Mammaliicoccus sciuri]MCD8861158.1 MTH1187 family thiamine-binding protein [Mammaliicoccus sciuri]MCO4322882.1 MTH1187 family thiamine-binding protein [Mammaliicoccus sciuri]MEB7769035.1 MTH1187 family thiamine-binding protein [Mammaliicoccus sciuri]MEB7818308.1 MTH1187 family thiamine-binding protein [Mammaliicoccus sciuri]
MTNTLMSIQIIPEHQQTGVIPLVDEAITIIDQSGLKYEVHPLETTIEGDLNACLILIEQINERMVELECDSIISQIKFYHVPEGITMDTLTDKYKS